MFSQVSVILSTAIGISRSGWLSQSERGEYARGEGWLSQKGIEEPLKVFKIVKDASGVMFSMN